MSTPDFPAEHFGSVDSHRADEMDRPQGQILPWISRVSGATFMVGAIGAGSLGLVFFDSCVARHDQLTASEEQEPGGGILIGSEVVRVYLPRAMIDLAKRRVSTHEDLRRRLELADQQNLWYVLKMRGNQVDGRSIELTFIRRPYVEPDLFPQFLNIVAMLDGDPVHDLEQATIYRISDELSNCEPREVISQLTSSLPFSDEADSRSR